MQFSSRILLGHRTSLSLLNVLNSERLKRVIDVGGALFALAIFSPVLLICAVAIRLGGATSVIFSQERMGRGGNPFKVLKLTTMNANAHLDGPLVTAVNDARVTRAGRMIRPLKIDELLQFVNVLRGEMSIVGPRPSPIPFLEWWPQAVKERVLSVRPGITGLAALYFYNEGTLLAGKTDVQRAYVEEILPQRLSLDLWYVSNRTLWLDLRIMISTMIRTLGSSRWLASTAISKKVLSSEDKA